MKENQSEETQIDDAPSSLEDALRRVRSDDTSNVDASVGSGDMEEDAGQQGGFVEDAPEGQAQGREGDGFEVAPEGSGIDHGDAGGYSDAGQETEVFDEESIDYDEVSKAYVQSTQRLAIDAANKLFQDNGVSKVTINDLYEKDDRGRVSFRNPDDPDRPFQSRAEAQQWCEAFNSQVDAEWRRTAGEFQRGYMKDIQPMLRLMSFAPEFEAMSPQEQNVFDKVVEDYAVKDKDGMTIGYSCDLESAKRVAVDICKSMGGSEQEQATQQAGSPKVQGGGPAIDAKTSGTGNPQNEKKDPKSLEEAMRMISEQSRKDRKNG